MDGSVYTRKSLTDGLGKKIEGENLYMKLFPGLPLSPRLPFRRRIEAIAGGRGTP